MITIRELIKSDKELEEMLLRSDDEDRSIILLELYGRKLESVQDKIFEIYYSLFPLPEMLEKNEGAVVEWKEMIETLRKLDTNMRYLRAYVGEILIRHFSKAAEK